MAIDTPETMSIPAAGKRYLGLGRNASYAAARAGVIPTIEVGKLKRAVVRAMEAKFDAVAKKAAK